MTTLAKLSFFAFQCHNTVLSRDGRSHVKFNPLSPNHVSCRRSPFKFNQLPFKRTTTAKCSPQSRLPVLADSVLNDAKAWTLSIGSKLASILLVFLVLKVALPSSAYHIDYVLTLLRKQKLARDALKDMGVAAAVGDNVQNSRCPRTGGYCLYGIQDSTLCCSRADGKNNVFWAHHMGYLFVLALQEYTEWVWSVWKKKTAVITNVDKVEEVVHDVDKVEEVVDDVVKVEEM